MITFEPDTTWEVGQYVATLDGMGLQEHSVPTALLCL
jgi:hypothetical protein